ncbi:MAG: 4-hydroxythreonine-4-phosphate dehydrogenase PdxA [Burkholderiaceae bacterium]|nr:MAG: 4-hydroxythreonine-4-phosphate dehydrogenase PdxA [Burkholderiaceae bacterium]
MNDVGPPVVAITTGEPAGIGPDICLQALAQARSQFPALRFVLLGDRGMLTVRARKLGIPLRLTEYQPERSTQSSGKDSVEVLHVPLTQPCEPGKLNPANARSVLALLDRAIQGAQQGAFAALVTAPVHKAVINEAGIAFSGHTEYLAAACGMKQVVMMLAGGGMRVALATTHLPLRAVPDAVNQPQLLTTLRIIDHDFRARFGIAQPRILVAGLNPHAGEGGYLGREEIDIIRPAIEQAQAEGIEASGPFPADTLFQEKYLQAADCVLAMYHDQGLPVLKHASFGQGVNITLGLPIVRVSVDHGTALDLAGSGKADHGSLLAAVRTVAEILTHV